MRIAQATPIYSTYHLQHLQFTAPAGQQAHHLTACCTRSLAHHTCCTGSCSCDNHQCLVKLMFLNIDSPWVLPSSQVVWLVATACDRALAASGSFARLPHTCRRHRSGQKTRKVGSHQLVQQQLEKQALLTRSQQLQICRAAFTCSRPTAHNRRDNQLVHQQLLKQPSVAPKNREFLLV